MLRMTDTMTSQNTDLSSWDIVYCYYKTKKDTILRHVACMGQEINCMKFLGGKPVGRKPLEGSWHRHDKNIKLDLMK
jgi:hypothetical protein